MIEQLRNAFRTSRNGGETGSASLAYLYASGGTFLTYLFLLQTLKSDGGIKGLATLAAGLTSWGIGAYAARRELNKEENPIIETAVEPVDVESASKPLHIKFTR